MEAIERKKKKETAISALLDKIVGIHFVYTRWSGCFQKKDHNMSGYYRKIEVCPTEDLRFYYRIRHAAFDRLIWRYGIPFMGFWIISNNDTNTVREDLTKYREEYFMHVEGLRNNFPKYIDKLWQTEPELARKLDGPDFALSEIMDRFKFEWNIFKLALPDGYTDRINFLERMERFDVLLFNDMALTARRMLTTVDMDRPRITSRVVPPLQILKKKLEKFKFITPLAGAGVRLIDTALLDVPEKGRVKPSIHALMKRIDRLIRDANAFMEACRKVIDGVSTLKVLRSQDLMKPELSSLGRDVSDLEFLIYDK